MTNPKTETTKTKKVPNELQIAGEIHTLANIIYRELATTQPWSTSSSTPCVFSEPRGWPPMPVGDPAGGWCGPVPWTQ